MHSFKYAAAAAALFAGIVRADDIDCDDDTATFTITAASAATISCSTVSGSLAFATDVSGAVTIDGPTTIGGDLIINNATQLTGLSSTTVTSVDGTFSLEDVQILESVSFPNLRKVGTISWIALPTLDTVNFGTAGVTKVSSIRISNTFMSTLEGMDLVSVDTVQIDNNKNLKTWSTGLNNITDSLSISSNGENLNVTLNNLTLAGSIDVRGVAGFSVPNLAECTGSFSMSNNTNLESISVPLLETVSESVSIQSNDALTNISMDALTTIGGGLTISDNTALDTINGFSALTKVSGAVSIAGNLTDVEFPSLNDVKGTFSLVSTADVDDSCTTLQAYKKSGTIQGKLTCTSGSTSSGSSSSSSGSSSSSSSSAGSVVKGSFIGAAAAAAVAALL